jgi:hypothetical protein
MACAHDVKVTKCHCVGLNNVLVFELTCVVTGNIPTEYIKCESTVLKALDMTILIMSSGSVTSEVPRVS